MTNYCCLYPTQTVRLSVCLTGARSGGYSDGTKTRSVHVRVFSHVRARYGVAQMTKTGVLIKAHRKGHNMI